MDERGGFALRAIEGDKQQAGLPDSHYNKDDKGAMMMTFQFVAL